MKESRAYPTTTYNQYRAKVSDGKSVRVVADEKVEAGLFYEFSGFFGAAFQSVDSGDEVILNIEQAEYETDQIVEADDFNVGDKIYFKEGKFTTATDDGGEEPTAHRLVGRVTQGKDENGIIWFILGPQL